MKWLNDLIQIILNALFPKPTPVPVPVPVPVPQDWEKSLLDLHNNIRSQNGIGLLTINKKLSIAAQNHSNWMKSNNKLSHDENGVSFTTRLERVNYMWRNAGENIAHGYATPEKAFQGWMNSSGHRKNILNSSFKEVGFGVAGTYWTVDFGSTAVFMSDEIHLPGGIDQFQ
jgi:uncharacterized protein YkwD